MRLGGNGQMTQVRGFRHTLKEIWELREALGRERKYALAQMLVGTPCLEDLRGVRRSLYHGIMVDFMRARH